MNQSTILEGRKVLVADDEPFNLSIVSRMMTALGCTDVTAARSGDEALSHLDGSAGPPDIAVLDFNMPGANGLQILKKVRTGELPLARETTVLMLTGNSDFCLVGAAMALDVDAFLIKPVSQQTMATRLEKALGQRGAVKSAAHYAAVEIDSVSALLSSQKPARPRSPARKANPNGIPVRLEALTPGAILSEDVRSPTGELLLGKATQLDERLILRLQELQSALELDCVYIFPVPANTPEA